MRRFLSFAAATAKENVWESCCLAGLASLTAGLWQVAPPLAFIVVGLALLALGLWGARSAALAEKVRKAGER